MAFDHGSFLFTLLSFRSQQNGPSSILPTHVDIFSAANGFLITSKNDSQFLVPPQVTAFTSECWAHMDIQNYGPWKRWLLFKYGHFLVSMLSFWGVNENHSEIWLWLVVFCWRFPLLFPTIKSRVHAGKKRLLEFKFRRVIHPEGC